MNEDSIYSAISGGLPDLRANSELPFASGPKRATPYESVMAEYNRVKEMSAQGIHEAGYTLRTEVPLHGGPDLRNRKTAVMQAVAERLLGSSADFEVIETVGGEPVLRLRGA